MHRCATQKPGYPTRQVKPFGRLELLAAEQAMSFYKHSVGKCLETVRIPRALEGIGL